MWKKSLLPWLRQRFPKYDTKRKNYIKKKVTFHQNEDVLLFKRHYSENEKMSHTLRENICKNTSLIKNLYP